MVLISFQTNASLKSNLRTELAETKITAMRTRVHINSCNQSRTVPFLMYIRTIEKTRTLTSQTIYNAQILSFSEVSRVL